MMTFVDSRLRIPIFYLSTPYLCVVTWTQEMLPSLRIILKH